MKVCLDAGHGGYDPGAVSGGMEEEDLTLAVVMAAKPILEKIGFEVILTRDYDVKVSNKLRCSIANTAEVDAFVAVHYNAATKTTAHGLEVIYAPNRKRSKALAQAIHDAMVPALNVKSRGVKTDTATGRGPFTVLHKTKMPAVIVEVMFITNPEERKLTDEPHEIKEIADALVKGIVSYLGQGKENQMPEKDDLKIAEKDTLNAWDELKEIFEDGKLDPKELPVFLSALVEIAKPISNLLTLVKVDPKVAAIIAVIVTVLESFIEAIEAQLPKIEAAWAAIQAVLKDDKVEMGEIPALLNGIIELIEAGIAVVLPFTTPEFTSAGSVLITKVQKVVGWIGFLTAFTRKVDRRTPPAGGGISG